MVMKNKKKGSAKKPIFRKVNTSKMAAQTKRRNLISLIKEVNLKESETKYLTKSVTFSNRNANKIYASILWGDAVATENVMPVQGITDATRVGDSVYARGYKVRFSAEILGSYNQSKLMFWYLPYNTEQGDPTDETQLFHWISGKVHLDPIQTKRWGGIKKIGQFYVNPKDADPTGVRMIEGSFFIPLNKKVNFKDDVTNQPTNLKEKGLLLWAFTGYNSTPGGVVMINSMITNTTLYFKDP